MQQPLFAVQWKNLQSNEDGPISGHAYFFTYGHGCSVVLFICLANSDELDHKCTEARRSK